MLNRLGASVRDPQKKKCEFNVSRGIAHLLERTVRMALWMLYYHNENKCYYKVNFNVILKIPARGYFLEKLNSYLYEQENWLWERLCMLALYNHKNL